MPRLLCLFLLLWTLPLGAQHLPLPSGATPEAVSLQLKSQRQKKAARGLLIGGGVVGVASLIGYTSAAGDLFGGFFSLQVDHRAARRMRAWRYVGAASGVAMLSSIPLRLAAKRNASKAQADLTLQLGLRSAPSVGQNAPLNYPCVGLRLDL